MLIENIFPTSIGVAWFEDHHLYEEQLVKKCLDIEKKMPRGEAWLQNNTYNSLSSYSILADSDFDPITNFVIEQVRQYCLEVGMSLKSLDERPQMPWFNIYRRGDTQEYHYHVNTLCSAVYFLSANPTIGAKLFVKSPKVDMLAPQYAEQKWENDDRYFYAPDPGKVVIMRGYVEHSVEQHGDDQPRISLVYNFKNNRYSPPKRLTTRNTWR